MNPLWLAMLIKMLKPGGVEEEWANQLIGYIPLILIILGLVVLMLVFASSG